MKNRGKVEWLSVAADLMGERSEDMGYVHVLDGMAYASNHHRLHYAETDLADGTYTPFDMKLVKGEVTDEGLKLPPYVAKTLKPTDEDTAKTSLKDFAPHQLDIRRLVHRSSLKEFCKLYVLEALSAYQDTPINIVGEGRLLILHGKHEFGGFIIAGLK